jgi:MAF protein
LVEPVETRIEGFNKLMVLASSGFRQAHGFDELNQRGFDRLMVLASSGFRQAHGFDELNQRGFGRLMVSTGSTSGSSGTIGPEFFMIPMILASNSPRRKRLLSLGGWTFTVQPADIDETPLPNEDPRAYTLRLAIDKACVVAQKAAPDALVIASDTTVADGTAILGKPVDAEEATTMLRQLRGRGHWVFTAIAVAYQGKVLTDIGETEVWMRDYSDEEIESYVASGDPLDKAGAYAIQHAEFHPVTQVDGCYASVMGLPVCHLARLLARLEIPHDPLLPENCQRMLSHVCMAYPQILG